MTASPAAGLVRAWVDLYTRGLPAELRAARRDEVADDLWCEQAEAATVGRSATALGADLVLRMLFGMPADVGWRLTYRGTPPPPVLERSGSMDTRTLGVMAMLSGLLWAVLCLLFIPFSHGVWDGTLGAFPWIAGIVAFVAFGATALGLAWRFQDQIGRVGAIGAAVVALCMFGVMGASILPMLVSRVIGIWLVIGLALLTTALARIGIISWLVPIALIAAIAGFGFTLSGANFDIAGTRALFVAFVAPFVLGWIWMGASLVRRAPMAPTTTG